MRFAVDVGGTFTDLVVEQPDGTLLVRKSPSTPSDPAKSVLDVLALAARDRGESLERLLSQRRAPDPRHDARDQRDRDGHGRAHRVPATQGHPDVLAHPRGRDGTSSTAAQEWPDPYVPRSLTFEIPERSARRGDRARARRAAGAGDHRPAGRARVEAVAVCLLWSTVNPVHEQRVGELLEERSRDSRHALARAQPDDARVPPSVARRRSTRR